MKKQYTKPFIRLESFVMSQSIAGGCGAVPGGNTLGKPGYSSVGSCGWNVGDTIVWVNSSTGCNYPWGADDPFNSVCYNNPSGGNNIFNS